MQKAWEFEKPAFL